MSDMQGRPPGWYPDERYPEDERWWDGQAWAAGTRPAGDHAVRSRSALDAADEKAARRARGWAFLLGSVGVAVALAVWALASR